MRKRLALCLIGLTGFACGGGVTADGGAGDGSAQDGGAEGANAAGRGGGAGTGAAGSDGGAGIGTAAGDGGADTGAGGGTAGTSAVGRDSGAGMGTAGTAAAGSDGAAGIAGSCSSFSPCGGDVLGTWVVNQGCAAGQVSSPGNCGETLDLSQVTFGSTMTFRADQMVVLSDRASGSVGLDVPKDCLTKAGMTTTCSDTCISYITRIHVPNGEITGLDGRQESATVCSCAYHLTATPVTVMSRYSVSGSTLTMDDAVPKNFEYCATATELRFRKSGDSGVPGAVNVLLKQ